MVQGYNGDYIGVLWGLYRDTGKGNGIYYSIWGLGFRV